MTFVCLWSPAWRTAAGSAADLAPALLAHVPRALVGEHGLLWADARGIDVRTIAEPLLALARERGAPDVRLGAAATPIAAEVAATRGELHGRRVPDAGSGAGSATSGNLAGDRSITLVKVGEDASFLASYPVDVLDPPPPLRALLDGLGIATCGDLARLPRESVEVRLGADGVRSWKLARGDDPRRMFTAPVRELPNASLEWVDYTLADPERMLFIINALAGNVCDALEERGEGARLMGLVLFLANGGQTTRVMRSARPTASRTKWMRQVRELLDKLVLPDAVTGILLRAEAVVARRSPQGDLFDRGFASAGALEQTLAQIIDDQGEILVAPESSAHPLLEARTRWLPRDPARVAEQRVEAPRATVAPQLALQLLPEPVPVHVEAAERRDHEMPVRYHDTEGWHDLIEAAGPDRVSGGYLATAYAREYFRGVRDDGLLVWLYRDARAGQWFLHGWWD